MAKIAKNLTELIGNTPLLELSNYNRANNLEAVLIAKLEYFNPASSVRTGWLCNDKGRRRKRNNKQRYGYYRAHKRNTGIALAFVQLQRIQGYTYNARDHEY